MLMEKLTSSGFIDSHLDGLERELRPERREKSDNRVTLGAGHVAVRCINPPSASLSEWPSVPPRCHSIGDHRG
jgi:hypothetical protein